MRGTYFMIAALWCLLGNVTNAHEEHANTSTNVVVQEKQHSLEEDSRTMLQNRDEDSTDLVEFRFGGSDGVGDFEGNSEKIMDGHVDPRYDYYTPVGDDAPSGGGDYAPPDDGGDDAYPPPDDDADCPCFCRKAIDKSSQCMEFDGCLSPRRTLRKRHTRRRCPRKCRRAMKVAHWCQEINERCADNGDDYID